MNQTTFVEPGSGGELLCKLTDAFDHVVWDSDWVVVPCALTLSLLSITAVARKYSKQPKYANLSQIYYDDSKLFH